jgi:hypothetical protein
LCVGPGAGRGALGFGRGAQRSWGCEGGGPGAGARCARGSGASTSSGAGPQARVLPRRGAGWDWAGDGPPAPAGGSMAGAVRPLGGAPDEKVDDRCAHEEEDQPVAHKLRWGAGGGRERVCLCVCVHVCACE